MHISLFFTRWVSDYPQYSKHLPMLAFTAYQNQNANTVKDNCNATSHPSEPIFSPALFFVPVPVAVVTPPTVTVPMIRIWVPLAPKLRTSPPTVTTPPGARVWPPNTTVGTGLPPACVFVTNVLNELGVTTTTPSLGDSERVFPPYTISPPGVRV